MSERKPETLEEAWVNLKTEFWKVARPPLQRIVDWLARHLPRSKP